LHWPAFFKLILFNIDFISYISEDHKTCFLLFTSYFGCTEQSTAAERTFSALKVHLFKINNDRRGLTVCYYSLIKKFTNELDLASLSKCYIPNLAGGRGYC